MAPRSAYPCIGVTLRIRSKRYRTGMEPPGTIEVERKVTPLRALS